VDHLREVAKSHDATPAQIALAWVLSKRTVASVLIGANKVAQLEDNLMAVDVKLSAEEIAKLDELTAQAKPYPHWFTDRVQDVQVNKGLKGE
jgi:aryl-alcohol dehydrogenase-like predicted oxidoreductase